MPQFGKTLIIIGALCILAGVLVVLSPKLPNLHIGRLPGDIYIKKENFVFYFPITTSLLISLAGIVVSLLIWLFKGK